MITCVAVLFAELVFYDTYKYAKGMNPMSLYRRIGIVAVAAGFALLGCRKDNRQPAVEAPSSDKREISTPQKGDPTLKRQTSPTKTAVQESPPTTDQEDSEAFFLAALNRQRKKDYKGAIELFERACVEGRSKACYQLGVIYRDGVGVKVNEQRAHSWFQLACQKDNVAACDALGH